MIYVYELVLLAREETVLQNMIDRLNKTGGFYETEMNVEEKNQHNEELKETIFNAHYDIRNNWKTWKISNIWVM
jgi:hypothetical protein